MAKREAYARGYACDDQDEITIGIEFREDEDDAHNMPYLARTWANEALSYCGFSFLEAVKFLEKKVQQVYPDRAYFIETERDGEGVQVFQPYGLPRDNGN